MARIAIDKQLYDEAQRLLEEVVQGFPNLIEAQSRLGKIYFERSTDRKFLKWHSGLPPNASQHPGIWVLRGRWSEKQSKTQEAIRSYGEALKRMPNLSRSNYQLGRLLESIGRKKEAATFFERSRALRDYINTAKIAFTGDVMESLAKAAEAAESLGLVWESYAWAHLAKLKSPNAIPVWASQITIKTAPQLASLPLIRSAPGSSPIEKLNLLQFPIPKLPRTGNGSSIRNPDDLNVTHVQFEDSAKSTGLIFQYYNGRKSNENGLKNMYEFSGGGVGILDFGLKKETRIRKLTVRWPSGSVQQFDNIGSNQDLTIVENMHRAFSTPK